MHLHIVGWMGRSGIHQKRCGDALPLRAPAAFGTYLLALAFRHDGRLVTFDSGIALAAVKGATARHLVTLV